MHPRVSVNICCYNSERFIKDTLESVLNQTFNDFEVVVIDDGSKDRTGEIIRNFNDRRIRYYYQNNRGLAASRNRAIELSNGEFIALLDHDDMWESEKLRLQVELFDAKPEVGLVFSDAYIVDENNRIRNRFFRLCSPHRGRVLVPLIEADFIPCLTAVIRKDMFRRIGFFREDLDITEDYNFFLRLSTVTEFDCIDKPLARYRQHQNNVSKGLEKWYSESIKTLTDFANEVNDVKLKDLITQRLSNYHIMLLLYYLSHRTTFAVGIQIRHNVGEIKNVILRFILYLLSYLPAPVSKIIYQNIRNLGFIYKRYKRIFL